MKHSIEIGSYMGPCNRALPEENLLAAMILRAYNDLFDKDPLIRRDAIIWLEGLSPGEGEAGISYKSICAALDLDADRLWNGMQEQLEEGFDVQEFRDGPMEDVIRRSPPDKNSIVGYGGHRNGSQTRMLLR